MILGLYLIENDGVMWEGPVDGRSFEKFVQNGINGVFAIQSIREQFIFKSSDFIDEFEYLMFSLSLCFGFGLHIFIIESINEVDFDYCSDLYIIFTIFQGVASFGYDQIKNLRRLLFVWFEIRTFPTICFVIYCHFANFIKIFFGNFELIFFFLFILFPIFYFSTFQIICLSRFYFLILPALAPQNSQDQIQFTSIHSNKTSPMLIQRLLTKRLFSTFKVSMNQLKKLRQQTSAPMGQCKKALQETQGNYTEAIKWLKQKGLANATKRQNKQTREGVVSAFVSECRRKAVLIEANCQTDFVAKSQLFMKYVNLLGHRLLQNDNQISIQQGDDQARKQAIEKLLQQQQSLNVFPENTDSSNAFEQLKVLISRLQQNIRIRRVVTLHSDHGRYGVYVHQAYQDGIGMQTCLVEATVPDGFSEQNEQNEVEIVSEFADNIAAQILGSPPKYLKAEDIPIDVLEEETEKVRVQMAKALEKAPQAMHDKMIAGKLNSNFYSHCFLPCMNYILSNDGIPVSQYWQEVERELGKEIVISSQKIWECK